MNLSDKIYILERHKNGKRTHFFEYLDPEDIKKVVKEIEYWGHIDLGKQTLTIDYDKFKEIFGEEFV